jgi:SAM-dependent methyltransferase
MPSHERSSSEAAREAAREAVPASSLYDILAPVYDRWQRAGGMTPFSEVALAKLLPALERHGRDAAGPGRSADRPVARPGARSFVDLGCGTGDLLLGLALAHPRWRLLGLDGSAAMLEIARGKPGADPIDWAQSPLTTPSIPGALDAAGCFYDTLNHLTEIDALDAAVAAIAGALRPGGLFVFDTTNERGFDQWWRQGHRTWRGRGWSVAVETHYDAPSRRGQAEVVVEDRDQRANASLTERCFSADEIRAAMIAAGFEVLVEEPWSPFDIDAPGKTWWIGRNRPR